MDVTSRIFSGESVKIQDRPRQGSWYQYQDVDREYPKHKNLSITATQSD
jgi:hypothetical protein